MPKMNLSTTERLSRAAIPAALALLLAGSAAAVLASALELAVPVAGLYLAAALAAALCAAGTLSGWGAVAASAGFVLTAAIFAAAHGQGLAAIRTVFAAWSGENADAAQVALGGRTLLVCGAFVLAAMFFALLDRREFVSMAVLAELALLVGCHAMSASTSVPAALPGLCAAAAAFALTGGVQRDFSALRVLVPAVLAACLALALTPGDSVTWKPLEEAAERVRGVFEQYFRFTRERVAFSINEEGYDHAGELGDSVVAMLGGPAQPHTDPVMRVDTAADTLLRGAIRTAYTGYSWVDAVPKSRYLYYDLTHRSTRDSVFTPSAALREALLSVDVSVEMLSEGTSTLFVPGLLEQFSMDLSTAVYYNTAGEVFLSREVQPGDRYSLRALLPEMTEALRQAAIAGESAVDDRYQDILALHTQLPEGIDGGVYSLTMQLTADADSAWDRAFAIYSYLRRNMRYTLRPDYPPRGRDFVSHFLLDTREGYCSYYASAMAVMGRIAGLPTRYVEGYLARPGQETLTGENAHAWAEVYFRGLGWIPFDATGGTTGSGSAGDMPDGEGGGGGETGSAEGEGDYAGPEATPSPAPDGGGEEDAPTPSPQPEDGEDAPEDAPGEFPEDLPEDVAEPESPPAGNGAGLRWLWWVLALALLALAALAARWAKRRLDASDPERACREAKSYRQAAMALYRANLTALAHLGHAPQGGEAPEAFAARVSGQLKNDAYVGFVRAVTGSAYGRQPLCQEDIDRGLAAYRGFLAAMNRRERLRLALARIARGMGDVENIP